MADRAALLRLVADRILALPAAPAARVAIDGVDGAGKSCFRDELAAALAPAGRQLILASVDSFHQPRAARYRQGRDSPQGFFEDSYDYQAFRRLLLDPLSPGGDGRFRAAAFDHRRDSPVEAPEQRAAPGAILLVDGIFLHRRELRGCWDLSIFLEVGFGHSAARMAVRDGSPADPADPRLRRYVEGQRLYLATCEPQRHASLVINNERLDAPFLVEAGGRR
ncbi:MAG TPA: hypothetical protein VGE07_22375 [Herpetosiphonaceae bacterium]